MKVTNKWLLIPYSIVLLFMLIPMVSLGANIVGVDWSMIDWATIQSALFITMECSFLSMVLILMFGIPTAYVRAKSSYKGKAIVERFLQIPLVLPPAVTGIILLLAFGRNGFIGSFFSQLGIQLAFSKIAIVITYTFIGLPVFIDVLTEGFRSVNDRLILSAMSLGDSPMQAFFKVTLPLSSNSLKVAMMMAWAKGIGEFGATMLFAGNIKGVTQTLPLAIYSMMESNLEGAMLLALLMMVLGYVIVYITKRGLKDD